MWLTYQSLVVYLELPKMSTSPVSLIRKIKILKKQTRWYPMNKTEHTHHKFTHNLYVALSEF